MYAPTLRSNELDWTAFTLWYLVNLGKDYAVLYAWERAYCSGLVDSQVDLITLLRAFDAIRLKYRPFPTHGDLEMLTDRAKVMMLLNEAARNNQKAEALEILFGCQKTGTVADWAAAYVALGNLISPASL